MWQDDYDRRLADWMQLRQRIRPLALADCLQNIQDWWQHSPWTPFYLHWDDRQTWPHPWQLLADNVFCDVARALGMLYTIHMLDRVDCSDACMVQSDQGNLVLVQAAKYIMNWPSHDIVNIASTKIKIERQLESTVLSSLTR